MARKSKKETLGSYVSKVGYFDIYQKFTYDRKGKITSSEYRVVHAKNVMKGQIKDKSSAVLAATELMGRGIKYDKHDKS
tara:strand:- start:85 stop:321 length:237 start_codon:yes stop_codon:yes gene_type:complete